jgi:molecular chaperone GrpE
MEQNASQAPQQDNAAHQAVNAAAPAAAQEPAKIAKEKREPVIVINDRRFWARDAADDEADAGVRKPCYVQELEQKLEEKEVRLQDTLTQYKEAKDEFEAARGRLRRDITREIEAGKRSMLVEILDVVDNLDRAINAAQAGNGATDALLEGVRMVRDQFLVKLQGLGVTRLDALHQPFNPAHHEAVSTVPVDDASQDGVVVGVVRDGYLIGEETLRYGMVAVGKFSAPTDQASAS